MIRKYALLIVIALVVAGGIVALRMPTPAADRNVQHPVADAPLALPPGAASAPDPNIGVSVPNTGQNDVDITVRGGRRASGPDIVRARQGEIVTFHITSDAAEEFTIRGYETQVQLVKGASATLIVKTNRAGSFPYVLRNSGVVIGTLEVAARP